MAHRISVPLASNVRNDFCRAINRQYGLHVRMNAELPRLGVCGRWTPRALGFTSGPDEMSSPSCPPMTSRSHTSG